MTICLKHPRVQRWKVYVAPADVAEWVAVGWVLDHQPVPSVKDPKTRWVEFAESLGLTVTGLTKTQVIDLVNTQI